MPFTEEELTQFQAANVKPLLPTGYGVTARLDDTNVFIDKLSEVSHYKPENILNEISKFGDINDDGPLAETLICAMAGAKKAWVNYLRKHEADLNTLIKVTLVAFTFHRND